MQEGLKLNEVELSRKRYGANVIESKANNSFIKKLIRNISDPLIRVLIAALIVTLLFNTGENAIFESAGIAIAIIVATVVSALSEYGSEKAFEKMQAEARNNVCRVKREGRTVEIGIEEIVCKDIVLLKAGEVIPADGYIIEGSIGIDASALNGESAEQQKKAVTIAPTQRDISDGCSVFRGEAVTHGEAAMLVCEVGENTYLGKMALEIQYEGEDSPLKQKMTDFAVTLSKFGYFCALCVAIADIVYSMILSADFVFSFHNVIFELIHALTLAVSVVVMAVPEGLPMMITVVLSSNMIKMHKQNVRVRKPVGIETAGSVSILFTDKTGTLTYGEPRAVCYLSGDCERAIRVADMSDFRRRLYGLGVVYASGCDVYLHSYEIPERATGGNGTDRALLNGYLACGEYPRGVKRRAYLPFDSSLKLCAATVDISERKDLSQSSEGALQ